MSEPEKESCPDCDHGLEAHEGGECLRLVNGNTLCGCTAVTSQLPTVASGPECHHFSCRSSLICKTATPDQQPKHCQVCGAKGTALGGNSVTGTQYLAPTHDIAKHYPAKPLSIEHQHTFKSEPHPIIVDYDYCLCGAIRSGETVFTPNADKSALVREPPPSSPSASSES